MGIVLIDDGTLLAPGLRFEQDLNTGIILSAADTLGLVAGGVQNLTHDSSGVTLVAKGTWTASGTWTIPAVTLGGTLTATGQVILVSDIKFPAGANFTIGPNANGQGSDVIIQTGTAAGIATRATFSGGVATSVLTWAAVTHTALVITSAGTIEGAGTGANGFILKNLKNAAASALSGVQLDVQIDIGGTPYYFTVYPTKA